MYKFDCKNCCQSIETSDKRQKFCSHKCVGQWTAKKRKPMSDEHKQQIRSSLKKFYTDNPKAIIRGQDMVKLVAPTTKGRFGNPKNIYNMSHRTKGKLMRRLDLPCSRCGWNEEICDLHHIHGKKINNPHSHENLSVLCPNCHRLFHAGKIHIDELITFEEQVGASWLEFYYG